MNLELALKQECLELTIIKTIENIGTKLLLQLSNNNL